MAGSLSGILYSADMSAEQFKMRLQLGMVLAVIAWGLYLATGAVLYNADYRKGVIILGSTAGFMAFWASAYFAAKRKMDAAASKNDDEGATAPVGWNFSSAFGFLLAAGAAVAMAAAAWGGWDAPGWAFAAMFAVAGASAIASIVGLSNPRRGAGRWLGLVGLALIAASFVIGFYVE